MVGGGHMDSLGVKRHAQKLLDRVYSGGNGTLTTLFVFLLTSSPLNHTQPMWYGRTLMSNIGTYTESRVYTE